MDPTPRPLDYATPAKVERNRRARPVLSGMSILAAGVMAPVCINPSYGVSYLLNEAGSASGFLALACAVLGGLGAVRREPVFASIVAVVLNVAVLVLWLSIGGKAYFGGSP